MRNVKTIKNFKFITKFYPKSSKWLISLHCRYPDWLKTCDVLHDLVPFAQFKKRKKHPWRSVTFSKVPLLECYFTESNIPPWSFFMFFKFCKWCQIMQRITLIVWQQFYSMWQFDNFSRINSPLFTFSGVIFKYHHWMETIKLSNGKSDIRSNISHKKC